jgi:hypothetical protein
MKISQLPEDVKIKAIKYQKNTNQYWDKTTDFLSKAFSWPSTEEGNDYWSEWYGKEFINPENLLKRIYDKVSNYLKKLISLEK